MRGLPWNTWPKNKLVFRYLLRVSGGKNPPCMAIVSFMMLSAPSGESPLPVPSGESVIMCSTLMLVPACLISTHHTAQMFRTPQ